ncbi:hypothetical protein H8A99_36795, partial [Bradyrhizobium sp. Arg68]|nr:hypothetical protein [Bradyrhizobium ivorense]
MSGPLVVFEPAVRSIKVCTGAVASTCRRASCILDGEFNGEAVRRSYFPIITRRGDTAARKSASIAGRFDTERSVMMKRVLMILATAAVATVVAVGAADARGGGGGGGGHGGGFG